MAHHNEIQHGDLVQDRITGFTGICYAITSYLAGCRRIHMQAQKLDEKGGIGPEAVADEPIVEIIQKAAVKVDTPATPKKPGGVHTANHKKPIIKDGR